MTVLRFVALGDSYTIGTSVGEADRWPNLLVQRLDGDAVELGLVGNLAANGFTSRDVIEVELPRLPALRPDFISLLIGVNDVVQGVTPGTFRRNVERTLDDLLGLVAPNRVLTVATPDYTVTPMGARFGEPRQQSAGIRANNAILHAAAQERGIAYVDTFGLSLRAGADRTLVAGDGLHPSGAQYGLWVDQIEPVVRELLAR